MEGVLVSALRGRSLKRDRGFLGRLALQLLSGIDAAHTSPLSDPEVLTLVVEELEVWYSGGSVTDGCCGRGNRPE